MQLQIRYIAIDKKDIYLDFYMHFHTDYQI